MKKIERYIYIILIIVLVGVIASGTTYFLVKDNNKTDLKENNNQTETDNNQENKEPVTKKDSVKLSKVYNLNDEIIEEFEITLNNSTQIMKVVFEFEEPTNDNYVVTGRFNNILILNNEQYNKEKLKKEDYYSINAIKKDFNENNFQIIKGKDNKNYLLIKTNKNNGKIYIFNDNLEIISKNIEDSYDYDSIKDNNHDYFYQYQDSSGINIVEEVEGLSWYGQENNCDECTPSYKIFKVEDNKIYYLALRIPQDWYTTYEEMGISGYGSKIEERIYTINNNKLEYKVINTYNAKEVSNMI